MKRLLGTKNLNPLIGFLAMCNVSLWGALFYLVYDIDQMKTDLTVYTIVWLLAIWLICGALLFFVALTIVAMMNKHHFAHANAAAANANAGANEHATSDSPVESLGTETLPRVSTLVIEVGAIAATLIYFWVGAQRWYFKDPKWNYQVDILDSLEAPGFALIGGYNDAVSAYLDSQWSSCSFPKWTNSGNTSCVTMFSYGTMELPKEQQGPVDLFTFNNTGNDTFATNFSTPFDQLLLQAHVTWNSRTINDSYKTLAPQDPTLYSMMYDPRMTQDDLEAALACNLLGWTEQPALGSTTYTIEEMVTIKDDRGILLSNNGGADKSVPMSKSLQQENAQKSDTTCTAITKKLHGFPDGYRTFRYHLSSSGTSFSNICDFNGTTQVAQACISQVLIRYGSFRTSSIESVPGKEKKDMMLDIAAIVGAVAYVGWFLTIFK
ncbi:hypothetical protein LTS09_014878 [Friedmanniomyces endolithicus]|nr:hypothetical protein LTS09_014878 [Friedmanniomyces endolithicus]